MSMPRKNLPAAVAVDAWQRQIEEISAHAAAQPAPQALEVAHQLVQRCGVVLLAAGRILAEVKARTTPREFSVALAKSGLSKPAVARLVAVWERYADVPSAAALAHLGVSKLLVLRVLKDSEIERLAAGRRVRNTTLDKLEAASVRQLELDFEGSADAASDWKRRYERTAAELRELKDKGKAVERIEKGCTDALSSVRGGVEQLSKLVETAGKLAKKDADQLASCLKVISPAVQEAAKLCQHKLGASKNRLAKLAREVNR